MKKIKELWGRNRIVFVLVCILIVCFIAIVIVASSFFFSKNKSNYGDRLDRIEEYPITEEFISSYKDSVKENKLVKDVSFRSSGRIIYITISFANDASLDEAKSIAAKSVEKFAENILSYYDIDFTIKKDAGDNNEGFVLMGARNVSGTGIVWNNNTQAASEESEKKK